MGRTKSFFNDLIVPKCTKCGKSSMLMTVNVCDGTIIEHHREIPCKEELCEDCIYNLRIKNNNGLIVRTADLCRDHAIKEIYKFNMVQLDEFQYHKSVMFVKDNVQYNVTIKGSEMEQIIKDAMNDKQMMEKKMSEKESLMDREKRIEMDKKALNFEKAEKFEEAMRLYEVLERWDDVGRMRKEMRKIEKESKEIVTKHIHINANDLFDQIKKGGLTIPYKCPNCSGLLKITGITKMQSCPYCGSDMDLQTLSEFVKTMLE